MSAESKVNANEMEPLDSVLLDAMDIILLENNLELLSMKLIRQLLETKFNCSLKHKKQLLSEKLASFVSTKSKENEIHDNEQNNEENESNTEELEEGKRTSTNKGLDHYSLKHHDTYLLFYSQSILKTVRTFN